MFHQTESVYEKRDETLIVPTEDEKHELIIDKIKEVTKQRHPILVIVLTISESQRLSEKLRARSIKHFVLNEAQFEDEDFIIDWAGKCVSVTIATNTAGCVTDIRLEKMSADCGVLHVIVYFFPREFKSQIPSIVKIWSTKTTRILSNLFTHQIYLLVIFLQPVKTY